MGSCLSSIKKPNPSGEEKQYPAVDERRGNQSEERRGSQSEERRGSQSEERRGSRTEERRGSQSEERRGSQSEERRGSRTEERRGSQSEERRGSQSEERRGSRTEERRGSQSEERRGSQSEERRGSQSEERRGSQVEERRGSRAEERRGSQSEERRGSQSEERRGSQSEERRGSQVEERRGSQVEERRGSQVEERRGSRVEERRGSQSTEKRASVSSEKRGSVSSNKRGSVSLSRRGSMNSEKKRGSVSSSRRGSVKNVSIAEGEQNGNLVKRNTKELPKKKIIILNGAPGSGKDTQCNLLLNKYNFRTIVISTLLKNYVKRHKDNGNMNEGEEGVNKEMSEEIQQNIKSIEKCFEDGSLVSDDIVIKVFIDELQAILRDEHVEGIVLNGYPRTYEQALLFKENNIDVSALININVSKEVLWERINSRLADPITNITYNEQAIELIKKKKQGEEMNEEQLGILENFQSYEQLDDEVLNRLQKRGDDEQSVFDKRHELFNENSEKIISLFSNVCKNINGERLTSEVFDDIVNVINEL